MSGTTTLSSLNITGVSPNSSGYYTLTAPNGGTAGANSLKVVYSGDTNYPSSSASLTITGVTALPTSVLASYNSLETAGQAFTLSALISGTLLTGTPRTGTLTLAEGGTTLASVNIATTAPNSSGYYR